MAEGPSLLNVEFVDLDVDFRFHGLGFWDVGFGVEVKVLMFGSSRSIWVLGVSGGVGFCCMHFRNSLVHSCK